VNPVAAVMHGRQNANSNKPDENQEKKQEEKSGKHEHD